MQRILNFITGGPEIYLALGGNLLIDYAVVNLFLVLLFIIPVLFLYRIFKNHNSGKINLLLMPAAGFLLLLGASVPLNFFSYYIHELSIGVYWGWIFFIELLMLIFVFFNEKKSLRKKDKENVFIKIKNNFFKKDVIAKIILIGFLLVNIIFFAFTYTNTGGDSAFHAAKINKIAASNSITNVSPRNSGTTDYVYLNNSYHQMLAGVSRVTQVVPYKVWHMANGFFRILAILTLVGFFYYIFKDLSMGIYAGIFAFIFMANLNVYAYPFEIVAAICWPLCFVLLSNVLQDKKLFVNGEKNKLYVFSILLIFWGMATLHTGMFALTFFIFAGMILLSLVFPIGENFNKNNLKNFWCKILFIAIASWPFLISAADTYINRSVNYEVANTQVTPFIAGLYENYEQMQVGNGRLLYLNMSPGILNENILLLILILFIFLISKEKVVKLICASYMIFLIATFSVSGLIISRFFPYWALIRFERVLNLLLIMAAVIAINYIIDKFWINKNLKNKVDELLFNKNKAAIINIVGIVFLLLASGSLASNFSVQKRVDYNYGWIYKAQRFANLAKVMEPNTVFVADWQIDHDLPSVIGASSYSIGENSAFLPQEKVVVDQLITYQDLPALRDTQDRLADDLKIDYIIISLPSKFEVDAETKCQNFNQHWEMIFYDHSNGDCLLRN